MKIETYLKTAISAERRKAEIANIRGLGSVDTGYDPLAIEWRWLDRISQTAQRRLLAVVERNLNPIAGVVSAELIASDYGKRMGDGTIAGNLTWGMVRRARRALGMK